MGPPATEPLGLTLTRTAKLVGRGFDQALATVDGTLPTWTILASLKAARHGKQQDIAEAVGIEGATLTHHLNRLERDGLVSRSRDPDNQGYGSQSGVLLMVVGVIVLIYALGGLEYRPSPGELDAVRQ